MCGIAGFLFNPDFSEIQALDSVWRMNDSMFARGPDGFGCWSNEGIILGHRRLAILDLDVRSNQPMISADRRYVIVFNGEIYNFQYLRQILEADGIEFSTTSDTEVLLALFVRDGEQMLSKLRGMFAFAIWDRTTRELFMARDPYGIKPLYFTRCKFGFVFASQVKALLASGLISPRQESAGLVGFYLWGSVPEPWTLYRDVFSLPAGHWMRINDNSTESPVCWYDIRSYWQSEGVSPAKTYFCFVANRMGFGKRKGLVQEQVRHAVLDSVRAHLVSDVPIGVFLSGGIDSGVVAGLSAELGVQVEGITIGFEEFVGSHYDEIPLARIIAAHYGLPHHVRQITRAEFEQDMPRILNAMDQPSIDGVNAWFASKAAAERGYKVVLSGIGGDELFCGYPSFMQIPSIAPLCRAFAVVPFARTLLRMSCAWLAHHRSQPKFLGIPEWMDSLEGLYFLRRALFLPTELPALMGSELAREGLARLGGSPPGLNPAKVDGAAAIGLLESTQYLRNQLLRDSDWASMAHSLELRTPLVDAALLAAVGPCVADFSGWAGKTMLAKSPGKPLPDSVIHRSKTGFGLPMAKWLSESADKSAWGNLPLLTVPGTHWARRWAKTIIERIEQ